MSHLGDAGQHVCLSVQDALLAKQSAAALRGVTAPKADGAAVVAAVAAGSALDFICFFSSIAAFVAAPGQANYAAANAALDSCSHAQQASGADA
jgi:KR domain